MKLSEIARHIQARIHGGDVDIHRVAGIEEARAGDLTFVSNPKYAGHAKATAASAVIVAEDFPEISAATLRTKNPYYAFARALDLFYQPPAYPPGIHPTAVIDGSARIGANAHVGAYCVIDSDVEIGSDCVLLPHVVIYRGARIGRNFFAHAHSVVREFCEIGNNVVLQNGVIVGGDGFGFAKEGGAWHKIVQSGPAVIENDVEIQANSCIDRASVGETRIKKGVKIDNLVQVGHGCEVGEHSLLCAQVGLAGSTVLGKDVLLAGQAAVAGHCKIGDGVIITAQSATSHDIEPGRMISGSPAIDNKQWLRCIAVFNRLPEIAKQLRELRFPEGPK
jgi:UDP-3-O-[3-hydroxymyristoyl] glucosamine N-acyltransferase